MKQIFPSLIASNIQTLTQTIAQIESVCDGFHFDVMDTQFVPEHAFKVKTINRIASQIQKQIQIHLMAIDPLSILQELELCAGTIIQIHIEIEKNILEIISYIRERNWSPSLVIKPKTPLESIFPFYKILDQVCLMCVEPGKSGQPFLPETIERLMHLVAYKTTQKHHISICMDGGISEKNIGQLAALGAEQFVVGSALFSQHDLVSYIKKLKSIL